MAALRIFACSRLSAILHYPINPGRPTCLASTISQIQHRWSSYMSSPQYEKPEDYTDYEITKDPNEWKYVELALKYKIIPKAPTGNVDLPSKWRPARASPTENPYFIERTKNYMQPAYLRLSDRGTRKITYVRKIHGDIWALEHDLHNYIEEQLGHRIGSQIYEFASVIKFKGDHVSHVKKWMDIKGF